MSESDVSPDVLEELYIEEGLTRQEVADELDVKIHHINYLLRKHKIYKTMYGFVQAVAREQEEGVEKDEYGHPIG